MNFIQWSYTHLLIERIAFNGEGRESITVHYVSEEGKEQVNSLVLSVYMLNDSFFCLFTYWYSSVLQLLFFLSKTVHFGINLDSRFSVRKQRKVPPAFLKLVVHLKQYTLAFYFLPLMIVLQSLFGIWI